MQVYNYRIATNQPLDDDFNSTYVQLKEMYLYSINAIVTGTPTGTIKLQASNDPITSMTPIVAPSNWVDIADSSFNLTAEGQTMWNVNFCGYNFVRVVYIDGSGGSSTATMDIIFNGKG